MTISRSICTISFVTLACTFAHAGIVKNFADDISSPVTTDAWGPFTAGLLLTGGLLAFEESIVDPTQTETVEDKPLGSSSKIGDSLGQGIPNVLYVIGALGAGFYTSDSVYFRRAKHMTLASAYSGIMAQVFKNIVREPRPNDFHDRVSFPSGHTTTAFAFASTVGITHGWAWGVPAYAIAIFVGYSRINDNMHYLHDVTAGATLGIGYGLGVFYSMYNRMESTIAFGARLENILVSPNSDGGESLVAQFSY